MKRSVFVSLHAALSELFGSKCRVVSEVPVSGGDINRAYRLTMRDGQQIFLKSNARDKLPMFQAEAEGLSAIAGTCAIRVPRVLCIGTDERYGAFLLMENITSARPGDDYWETFGHRLAAMHRADTSALVDGVYGFHSDNFIGERPQSNTAGESWVKFFRDQRLAPQFRDAAGYFDAEDRKRIMLLLDHLDDFLIEPKRPSLLHGDLWSGNFLTDEKGEAMLIDPAVYVGHAEADIAMTELFGGFSSMFYEAYQEIMPLQPGYEQRRDIYNLYHLLNHLNIFGASYLGAVRRIIRQYAG